MFHKDELKVMDWVIFWIVMAIPVVNFIVFLILLFSGDTNQTLRNMLKAQVLLVLLAIGVFILFWGTIIGVLAPYLPFNI
jgi:hypothetical protein